MGILLIELGCTGVLPIVTGCNEELYKIDDI